ncbi:MAG: hypothetical protein E7012_06040 [Alphaproteobacteria bacterium]|nr:hypothetical protein [Alphaproteobacteria bacterium]
MNDILIATLADRIDILTNAKPIVLELTDLSQNLKSGMLFTLQNFTISDSVNNNGLLKLNVKTQKGENLVINVKIDNPSKTETLLQNIQHFEVKSAPNGKLYLYPVKNILPTIKETSVSAFENIITDEENLPIKIATKPVKLDMQPVKLANLIDNIANELKLPTVLKKEIHDLFSKAEVYSTLKEINTDEKMVNQIIEPIKNVIKQMPEYIDKPKEMFKVQQELITEVKNLTGKIFEAQVAENKNYPEKLVLESSLGKLVGEGKLKLPVKQSVSVEIIKVNMEPQRELLPLVKNITDKLTEIWPKEVKFSYDPEIIIKLSDDKSDLGRNFAKLFKGLMNMVDAPERTVALLQKIPGMKADVLENIFNYYKAVEKKDISLWLGEKQYQDLTDTKQGKETVKQIEQVFVNAMKDTPLWKVVDIPFFDGKEMFIWKLMVKKNNDEKSKNHIKNKDQRFILDTEFSVLGKFQFDGYASVKERKFDLIIRTSKMHDNDFCLRIMNLFKKSLHDVSYSGAIRINQKEIFVHCFDGDEVSKNGVYI